MLQQSLSFALLYETWTCLPACLVFIRMLCLKLTALRQIYCCQVWPHFNREICTEMVTSIVHPLGSIMLKTQATPSLVDQILPNVWGWWEKN
mmetsp:Transcript_13936/g.38908  ORF Transcript_13936/g.38908 Transcript_13936/m.38908 type:complete len:92 (+) Transcript_13936:123-398(+)